MAKRGARKSPAKRRDHTVDSVDDLDPDTAAMRREVLQQVEKFAAPFRCADATTVRPADRTRESEAIMRSLPKPARAVRRKKKQRKPLPKPAPAVRRKKKQRKPLPKPAPAVRKERKFLPRGAPPTYDIAGIQAIAENYI